MIPASMSSAAHGARDPMASSIPNPSIRLYTDAAQRWLWKHGLQAPQLVPAVIEFVDVFDDDFPDDECDDGASDQLATSADSDAGRREGVDGEAGDGGRKRAPTKHPVRRPKHRGDDVANGCLILRPLAPHAVPRSGSPSATNDANETAAANHEDDGACFAIGLDELIYPNQDQSLTRERFGRLVGRSANVLIDKDGRVLHAILVDGDAALRRADHVFRDALRGDARAQRRMDQNRAQLDAFARSHGGGAGFRSAAAADPARPANTTAGTISTPSGTTGATSAASAAFSAVAANANAASAPEAPAEAAPSDLHDVGWGDARALEAFLHDRRENAAFFGAHVCACRDTVERKFADDAWSAASAPSLAQRARRAAAIAAMTMERRCGEDEDARLPPLWSLAVSRRAESVWRGLRAVARRLAGFVGLAR